MDKLILKFDNKLPNIKSRDGYDVVFNTYLKLNEINEKMHFLLDLLDKQKKDR